MRNTCSLGLLPGMIGNPNIIVCGPMGRERGPRSPAETGSNRWWLVTIATCAAAT